MLPFRHDVYRQGCQFFQLSHEYRIASGTIGPMVFRYREALSPVLGYLRSTLRPLRPDAHAHDLETINPARKVPSSGLHQQVAKLLPLAESALPSFSKPTMTAG